MNMLNSKKYLISLEKSTTNIVTVQKKNLDEYIAQILFCNEEHSFLIKIYTMQIWIHT